MKCDTPFEKYSDFIWFI